MTLRVYSLDGTQPATVRVSVYGIKAVLGLDIVPDVLLGVREFPLRTVSTSDPSGDVLTIPGFLELSQLDFIAPAGGFDRLRIDVLPVSPGTRIWAFVSVTNNETQHVTIIAPSL